MKNKPFNVYGKMCELADDLEKHLAMSEDSGIHYLTAKAYGAIGDGEIDDTEALQEAIYASTGKTLVLEANKTYKISRALIVPFNVSINGQNSIIKGSGYGVQDWAFLVNTTDKLTQIKPYNIITSEMRNLIIKDTTNGIFLAGNYSFKILQFNGQNIGIERMRGTYLDECRLENIFFTNRKFSDEIEDYAIEWRGMGDACIMDSIMEYSDELVLNRKEEGILNTLRVHGQQNRLQIKNYLGANAHLVGNVDFENLHMEWGRLTIQDALVNIKGGYFHIRGKQTPITCKGTYALNMDGCQFSIPYHNNETFHENMIFACITGLRRNVNIHNCYKSLGLSDLTFDKTPIDFANDVEGLPTWIDGTFRPDQPYTIQARNFSVPSDIFLTGAVPYRGEQKEWHYTVRCYADYDRGIEPTQSTTLYEHTLTTGEKSISYMGASYGLFGFERTDGNITEHCVVPYISGGLIDNGICINGYLWKEGALKPVVTKAYELMYNIGSGVSGFEGKFVTLPESATFQEGDIATMTAYGQGVNALNYMLVKGKWKLMNPIAEKVTITYRTGITRNVTQAYKICDITFIMGSMITTSAITAGSELFEVDSVTPQDANIRIMATYNSQDSSINKSGIIEIYLKKNTKTFCCVQDIPNDVRLSFTAILL